MVKKRSPFLPDGASLANDAPSPQDARAKRCPWPANDVLYQRYHDEEWGVPCRDAQALFELLLLEGLQAGLAWITILRKRRHFRAALHGFDAKRLARLTARDIERLMHNPDIVRHRGKLEAVRDNARCYLALHEELQAAPGRDTAVDYLWSFVGGAPEINRWRSLADVPAATPASEAMAKALKRRGFRFVGPTICYAFMQSAGMVNDHLVHCFRHREVTAPEAARCLVE